MVKPHLHNMIFSYNSHADVCKSLKESVENVLHNIYSDGCDVHKQLHTPE